VTVSPDWIFLKVVWLDGPQQGHVTLDLKKFLYARFFLQAFEAT
jgi:hypothetical protein